MNDEMLQKKLLHLKAYLKELGSVAVAFSGGVDSTFLLKAAQECLGDAVLAVTVSAAAFPERECREAREFCEKEGIRQLICSFDVFEVDGFAGNPPNRCYLCKKELFRKIQKTADEQGIYQIVEGSNMDDSGDYRPGMMAVAELGIKSPLRVSGLYKAEIRQLSRRMGLSTWQKPSFACLASRFVYGESITQEKLRMVDQAEQLLMAQGFRQFRVRIHDKLARIEVLPEEFEKLVVKEAREEIVSALKSYGFTYVSMDLAGYRTGSMNETLVQKKGGMPFDDMPGTVW